MQEWSRCDRLVEGYLSALREDFQVQSANGRCLIVTPFVRPDGGLIEIEAQILSDGHLRLSDLGESIAYLYVNGLTVTRAALDEIRKLCRRRGVTLDNYELTIEIENESLQGERVHSLIQVILVVTDMIQKRRPYQRLRFDEVVETFLVGHRTVYDSDFRVQGEDSVHRIRFHVDSDRRALIQPLSPNTETAAFSWAERWAYRFDDIKRHDPSWRPFAVLDDRGARARVWTPRCLVPLRRDATVIHWSDNAPLAESLASGRAQ